MNLSLKLPGAQRDPGQTHYQLADLSSTDEDSSFQLWPKLIRFEGGILAGVETQVRTMYSGGGASSSTLHLIAFLPGQAPFKVLSVPQSASVMIRACFSEHDMKQRAGACHDEYSFNGSLALTGASVAAMPVLRYRSKATTFPGPVSRSKDSLAGRPLHKRDIITVTDPQCSYQRLYHFEPTARAYVAISLSPTALITPCPDNHCAKHGVHPDCVTAKKMRQSSPRMNWALLA
ncbi:hypothetical protein [Janthinobacterium sp. B9-8]|uniref:hypothetical protein n=1 Tax=Janthinobacterium sp. B9-8 TaxID=1236179 RepID=UPI000AAB6A2B|nr:hypothetical protein [Janthinobacterium sp. B9-8]